MFEKLITDGQASSTTRPECDAIEIGRGSLGMTSLRRKYVLADWEQENASIDRCPRATDGPWVSAIRSSLNGDHV